jgi:pimeloyl-ACP methyl ester carboxylesterase
MFARLLATVFAAHLLLAGDAAARTAFAPCRAGSPVLCGTVTAPLDPSHRQPGSVRLHVEVFPGASAKTLFLVAGGPGQASTRAFDLRHSRAWLQARFPGYTLVAFDDRGTGRSDPASCPMLTNPSPTIDETQALVLCARRLGTARPFYSSAVNAADLDVVRRAVGAQKITLYGVSYGTRFVLAYAAAYPSHVGRIVLDSVVSDPPDGFQTATLRSIPGALDELCRNACSGLSKTFVALASRLAGTPREASAPWPGGPAERVDLTGLRLLRLAVDTDLSPGLAAELPPAIASADGGDLRPLARLELIDRYFESRLNSTLNAAVFTATYCNDGGFPWKQTTPVARRGSLLRFAAQTLPLSLVQPFGRWALSFGTAGLCESWPPSVAQEERSVPPYPDVPVLLLEGGRDMRAPVADAQALLRRFPHAQLLVVRGAGHAVLGTSVCAGRFVAAWLSRRRAGACGAEPLQVPVVSLPAATTGRLSPAGTLASVLATIREAKALAFVTHGGFASLPGVRGGSVRTAQDPVAGVLTQFHGYSDAAGVTLDGDVEYLADEFAVVEVGGSRAAHGTLTIAAGKVTGTLGGRRISARI